MIDIKINTEILQADLQRLARRLQQRKTLTAELSRILHHAVLDNFAAGGRPAWKPRKYPAKRNTALLQATGALRQSLTRSWDNNQATVGTNLVYAAIHNFGGQTRPHTIRPKNGKVLAFGGKWSGRGKKKKFGGTFAAKVEHPGSRIPARPFMVLQPEDERALADAVRRYLDGSGR